MTRRSYAVIGTGAVGGFYGARLQRAGFDVHFLLHSDYEHVSRHGLRVDSCEGDFRLPQVHAYARVADMPRCDVVLFTLKATGNQLIPELVPPVLSPGGMVLVLQKGLGAEEEAARAVEAGRVLGAMSFICAEKPGPGHIRHLDYGAVSLAEYDPRGAPGGITRRMRDLAADLEAAGIQVLLAEDLVLARWKKLVWNVPYNGLSVALNATTAELMGHPQTRALVEDLMREVAAGAAALGRKIPAAFIQQMLADTDRMKPYQTSMKRDFDRGRPLEIEAIYGRPLHVARDAGAQLPKTEMLYALLRYLDAMPRGSGAMHETRL